MSTTFLHGESGCACSRNTCKGCITYETYKTVKTPTTNADRIRAMTDEEMAEHLYLLRLDALRLEGYEGFIETKDEILDWLKSVHRLAEEVDDEAD